MKVSSSAVMAYLRASLSLLIAVVYSGLTMLVGKFRKSTCDYRVGQRRAVVVIGRLRGSVSIALGIGAAALMCLSPSLAVAAQQFPGMDSGQIMRENVQRPQIPPGRVREMKMPPAPSAPKVKGGGQVLIKGFRFTGNEGIGSDELMEKVPVLGESVGKRLDISALNNIAEAVTQYYREHGYLLAVAYVPPQKISNGIVNITVFEGRFDQTRIIVPPRYSEQWLNRYMNKALCGNTDDPGCADAPVMKSRVERASGLVADLPGVEEVRGILAPGGRTGTTNLTLQTTPGPEIEGKIGGDNYGTRHIGRERVFVELRANNPFRIGDVAIFNAVSSGSEMINAGIDYSLPVGYDGWRAGINYSHMLYSLKGDFALLDARGYVDSLGVYALYPIIRNISDNLFFRVDLNSKWLVDKLSNWPDQEKDVIMGSVGFSGNKIDRIFGGGYSAFDLVLSHGDAKLRNEFSASNDDGTFTKYNLEILRDQTLGYWGRNIRFSLYGNARGQYTDDNLVSSEDFTLGGPNHVRAYPIGEASCDRGLVATVELRASTLVPLWGGSDLTIAAFRDMGFSENLAAGNTPKFRRSLRGNGALIELKQRDKYTIKFMWAARDSSSEVATSSDDEDRDQYWIRGVFMF